jgi:hypothetical protein
MRQMVPEKLPDTDLVDSVDCKIRYSVIHRAKCAMQAT